MLKQYLMIQGSQKMEEIHIQFRMIGLLILVQYFFNPWQVIADSSVNGWVIDSSTSVSK